MKSKYLGMILALHAGDSLGATLEFCSPQDKNNWQTEIIGGGHFRWNPGDATDDTDLALAVLESIQNNRFNQQECISKFIEWYKKGPRDIGQTTRLGIESLENGSLIGPNVSLSNGSLMRCAPLAVLNLPRAEVNDFVEQATLLTHNNAKCVYLDKVFIEILQYAFTAKSKLDVYNFAKELTKNNLELATLINAIPTTPWNKLSTSGYVVDGIICALWSLYHTDSVEEGLVQIVNRGDDSDTNGAISGALLGAFYGVEGIPERYLRTLQYRDRITNYINSL